MAYEVKRSGGEKVLRQYRTGTVEYLKFPALEQAGIVEHLFTTRLGGVSEGYLESMNLSYGRGDQPERVDENFRRIARIMGCTMEDFVCPDQTHTANVRRITAADRGKGVIRPRDYTDVDGLVTDVPGIVLATFYADCVPLYFVDPVRRVIGLSHSGWRGTVAGIGKATVEKMRQEYASRPEDIIAAIGPSICRECYEIDRDVAEAFRNRFVGSSAENILTDKGDGKYLLDLWRANKYVMLEAGILPEHISTTDICTCCNPGYLFSHRASHGKRGNMGAFLALKNCITD